MDSSKNTYDCIVLGAGSAGLLLAPLLASSNMKVALLEAGSTAGRKLSLSGGTRGNFTHKASNQELLDAVYEKKAQRFLRTAFSHFNSSDLRTFFHNLSVRSKVENDGRVFPKSDKASELVSSLLKFCHNNKVEILYKHKAIDVSYDNSTSLFQLTANNFSSSNKYTFYTPKLFLTCGGASYPHTGSDGSGFLLASKLGHKIEDTRAALHFLPIRNHLLRSLSGLSFDNIGLKLSTTASAGINSPSTVCQELAALVITHQGLSGPAALHLSRFVSSDNSLLELDFLPQLTRSELQTTFKDYIRTNPRQGLSRLLENFCSPKSLGKLLLKICTDKYPQLKQKNLAHLNKAELQTLLDLLKSFPLEIAYEKIVLKRAMLTRGGVSLDEINAKTMESRLIHNLYFAGEIMDVDAKSGGYNLQIAFSTANLAAKACLKGRP